MNFRPLEWLFGGIIWLCWTGFWGMVGAYGVQTLQRGPILVGGMGLTLSGFYIVSRYMKWTRNGGNHHNGDDYCAT